MKLPLLYMVTGTSSVSTAVRAEVIWMRTVYLVEMMGLLMVVQSVGMVMKYRFLNSDGLLLDSSRMDDAITAFCLTRRGCPSYGSDSSSRCSTVKRRDLTYTKRSAICVAEKPAWQGLVGPSYDTMLQEHVRPCTAVTNAAQAWSVTTWS